MILSQNDQGKKGDTHHEIGLNLTNVLSSFLAVNNNALTEDPYSLSYKYVLGKSAIRSAISITFRNSLEDDIIINGQRAIAENQFGLKLGYERRIAISEKFTCFLGMDILGEYFKEESKFVPNFGEQVSDVQHVVSVGGGPVLGIMFHLNPRISFGTESTLYFIYGQEDSETKFLPSGEIFSKDKSKFFAFDHMLPQSLFFIYQF